jgi:hypothetical protein
MSTNPFSDPYQSPQYFSPPPPQLPPGQQPAVWTWYIIFCAAMAILYLLCIGLGMVLLAMLEELSEDGDPPELVYVQGIVVSIMGGVLFLLYAAAPFLPRSKAAWIVGFVTIGIGLTSCCTMPFSIARLIQWLKPEVKSFLNVT